VGVLVVILRFTLIEVLKRGKLVQGRYEVYSKNRALLYSYYIPYSLINTIIIYNRPSK
jgi:hypothetical protein